MLQFKLSKNSVIPAIIILLSVVFSSEALACHKYPSGVLKDACKGINKTVDTTTKAVNQIVDKVDQLGDVAVSTVTNTVNTTTASVNYAYATVGGTATTLASDGTVAATAAANQAAAEAKKAEAVAKAKAKLAAAEAQRLAAQTLARSPISASDLQSIATRNASLIASKTQGAAVNAFKDSLTGVTAVGGDLNSAFSTIGDELEAFAKSLNPPFVIPDVPSVIKSAAQAPLKTVQDANWVRLKIQTEFQNISKEELGIIASLMKSVAAGTQPSANDIQDVTQILNSIFAMASNGCTVCPLEIAKSSIGFALTVSAALPPPSPLGAYAGANIMMSTYPVNGKPKFVVGWSAGVTASPPPATGTLDYTFDIVWASGALSDSDIPTAAFSLALETPPLTTPAGVTASGGGSVSITLPDTLLQLVDKNKRKQMLAKMKTGPTAATAIVAEINSAITQLKQNILNPGYSAGVSFSGSLVEFGIVKPETPGSGIVSFGLNAGGVLKSF